MPTRRLVINSTDKGQFFLLVEGDTVTIGGPQPDTATVLQHLRVVRVHCELEVEGDHVTCRNDVPAGQGTPRELHPGELVYAGTSDLRLEAVADTPAQEVGRLADPRTPAVAQEQPGPALMKRLIVIDGADQGRSFPLPGSGIVTLGKDRKHCDFTLHDLYVGGVHCRLEIGDEKVEAVDAGGEVLVNGKKVTRQTMNLGDVLRIGNSHLRLETGLVGEEVARVSAAGEESDDTDTIEVVEEGKQEAALEDEEPEVLPKEVSERVRLLHQWRSDLTKFTGQKFGHYQIGPVLGRGRCGVVFQADDLKTNQTLALKVFSPQFPYGPQELQRFAAGMKGLLSLRHPNLVALYGAGKTGIYTWIAREYIEGESVFGVIRRQVQDEHFNERRACRVAIHVARTLDFAHKHRLRHGNISPKNILIQESDKVAKLADLMLDNVLEGSLLRQAVLEYRSIGEVSYLSPEQATPGAFADELSDLYSLGAVVYALLTGRPPFLGDTTEETLEEIRSESRVDRPSTLNAAISAPLEKVVLRMLSKRQEERYQTPAELLADLEAVAEKLGVKV